LSVSLNTRTGVATKSVTTIGSIRPIFLLRIWFYQHKPSIDWNRLLVDQPAPDLCNSVS
jgi:hypothetical protein